jgi:hypothetical protein
MFNTFFAQKDRFAGNVALGIIFAAILIGLGREGFRFGQMLAGHVLLTH